MGWKMRTKGTLLCSGEGVRAKKWTETDSVKGSSVIIMGKPLFRKDSVFEAPTWKVSSMDQIR